MSSIIAIAPPRGSFSKTFDALLENGALAREMAEAVVALIGLAREEDGGCTLAQFEATARADIAMAREENETGLILGFMRLEASPTADITRPQRELSLAVRSLAQEAAQEIRVNAVTLRGLGEDDEVKALEEVIAYLAGAPSVTGQVIALAAPALQGQPLED